MKRSCLILLLFIMSFSSVMVHAQSNNDAIVAGKDIAVVATESGKVRGYIHNGLYTYKGIPYAQADRFMPPSKPAPWSEVRSSLAYGTVCPTDATTTVNDEFEFPFHHDLGYSNEHCQT